MIYPDFLKKGNKIGVPAPSGGAYDEPHCNKYNNSKKKLEEMGYEIKWSKNIFNSIMARSADAKTRANELNDMIEDDSIDFIICASGGEFLVEILPYTNLEGIVKHPKYVQGFSDPTGILFPITTKYDIATIYGLNFGDYGTEDYTRDITDNLQIITGNVIQQDNYEMFENERLQSESKTGLEGYNFTDKVEWKVLRTSKANGEVGSNEEVSITGRIIGGCLDIISELAGTKYDGTNTFIEKYKEDGIIWYFDNCELSMEELIRTMWKLNEFGYFKYTKGIIFGRNGQDISCLDYTMETALKDSILSELNVPIIYDADVSHKGPCLTIINGAIATVKTKGGKGNINFELR